MRAATVVQQLCKFAGLVLSVIACFILLVIAHLGLRLCTERGIVTKQVAHPSVRLFVCSSIRICTLFVMNNTGRNYIFREKSRLK